jgi:hypothetical protein
MEFSFKVSEAEFLMAARLERKKASRSSLKTAAFWVLVMLGMMFLCIAVQPSRHQPSVTAQPAILQSSGLTVVNHDVTMSQRVGPFLVLGGVWVLIIAVLMPIRLRFLYRKDPRMQGEFTIRLSVDSISTENTAGTLSLSAWSIYEYWCEDKGVIVLMFRSGAYSILSLAGLSGAEQNELRSILSAALPKK